MRQKKSNLIYYVIGIVVLAGVLFVASQEVPVKVEQVDVCMGRTSQPRRNKISPE